MGHKILLISDTHFGIRNNSERFLQTMEDFFYKTLANVIKTRKITDCRLLGDLFDCRNNINVRTLNSVLQIFKWYREEFPNVKWKILLGNHDIYYRNRIDINSLEALRFYDNVEIIDSIETEEINGKKIITFPWLVHGGDIQLRFDEYCNGKEKFDLCLGHFEIKGFEMVRGHVDDTGTSQGKFKNFRRVFTGHYHIRSTKKHITYLGCPYQLTWNDYGDDKGIHIYDLEANSTEFIPNTDSPIYVRLKVSEILKDNSLIKKVQGNTVKIVIDKKYEETEILEAMTKIETANPMKIGTDNQYVEDDINDDDVEITDMNDARKFLLEYINKIELDEDEYDRKVLSKFASEIYDKVVSDND